GDDGAAGAGADVALGRDVGEQEERGADGVVAAPAVGDVEGASSGDDRPTPEHLFDHRAAAGRGRETVVGADGLGAGGPPVEEPGATVAQRVARTVVRSGDVA